MGGLGGPASATPVTLFPSSNAPGGYVATVPTGICFVTVTANGGSGGTPTGGSGTSVESARW